MKQSRPRQDVALAFSWSDPLLITPSPNPMVRARIQSRGQGPGSRLKGCKTDISFPEAHVNVDILKVCMTRNHKAKLYMSSPESWPAQDYSIPLETTKSIRTHSTRIERDRYEGQKGRKKGANYMLNGQTRIDTYSG